MPAVKLIVSEHRALFISSITLNSEIMSPCSYYMKKGLVYVVIADPSNYQLFSYFKYTKLNTYILYNMRSVSFNKYIFLIYYYYYLFYLLPNSVPFSSLCRLLPIYIGKIPIRGKNLNISF